MKFLFSFALFSTIFGVSCQQPQKTKTAADEAYEREYAKIANVTPAPPSNAPIRYGKVVIGMNYKAFITLCGQPNHISTYDSASGQVATLTYEYTKKRGDNDCWGTFTFTGDILDSVYRG